MRALFGFINSPLHSMGTRVPGVRTWQGSRKCSSELALCCMLDCFHANKGSHAHFGVMKQKC